MAALPDDLSREVYCVLGLPVDNIGTVEMVERMEMAMKSNTPFLVATPNVNFMVNGALDETFRETLVFSDLCVPDGKWLVWLARLMGVPIENRVAGADILETLERGRGENDPLKVLMFGGPDGVGEKAGQAINARHDGLLCVGAINPGFGSLEQMSTDEAIAAVNSSRADFLLVALGAKKGQRWLYENHGRLSIPVRAHLGATINFYSGAVKRAPARLQRWGLEWAWRIKEEPELWRRYAHDASYLARFFIRRILPLAIWNWYLKSFDTARGQDLTLTETSIPGQRVISLKGYLTTRNVEAIAAKLRAAIAANEDVVMDLSGARAVDARFAGLLLMLEKRLRLDGGSLRLAGASPLIESLLRLYGLRIPGVATAAPAADPASPVRVTPAE